MEDTAYRIIIMAQADQALHHIVLHVKQSFSNEIAKSVYQDIILYRVFDDEKEARIYNIFSQRQDYLQLLQGL